MNAPSVSPEELAQLATLHDIVEPAAVAFWPVAPAWWLVALFALLVVIRLTQVAWMHWARERYRRSALRRLRALEARRHAQTPYQTVHDALDVLRACALAMHGADAAHPPPPPTDRTAWIGFLRARLQASHAAIPETLVRDAPYWPPERVSTDDAAAVLCFVRGWITDHERPG